jgi:hypothetical protein
VTDLRADFIAGSVKVLRDRAEAQLRSAEKGTTTVNGVTFHTPEAVVALRLAAEWLAAARELENMRVA